MNYITEINAFYDVVITSDLTADSIALWHVLMNISNRAGWPRQFKVPASVLQGYLNYSYSSLSRARKELVDAGIIRHIPMAGRQAPYYQLLSLTMQKGKTVDKVGLKLV